MGSLRAADAAAVAVEVATLDGVGRGTTLAGRYRLEERLQAGSSTSMWRARDTTLDRPVAVRVVAGGSGQTVDTLDAARRASLVEDPRLLRVLDVGTHAGGSPAPSPITYIVWEYVDGESLATRLAGGPMRASAVRAVVGEAAEALERARTAGLHHERLTPSSVALTPDDAVKISGLGVDATLEAASASDTSGQAAARSDAVALVALLYAGLTGRWPFGSVDRLPAAPRVAGRPVPPSDIVPGVPADLDRLCEETLGARGGGPRTPGEVAARLMPWGPEQVPPPGGGPADGSEETREMRPLGRFPVRLGASGAAAGAVGAGVAAAAAAAGLRPEQAAPETRGGTAQERWDELALLSPEPVAAPPSLPGSQPAGPQPGASRPHGDDQANQAKIVLGALAVLLLIGLVLAVNSLSNLGGGTPAQTLAPQPQASPSVSETTEPAASEEEQAPPAANAPTIQGVRTLDPQGDDGAENDETAAAAIDGDPATFWESSTYRTADFGNLKDGVGMVVDLGRPSALSGVRLEVAGSGGTVEIRTSAAPTLDGSTIVATADITGEPVDVPLAEAVETQYVLLWFTRLPETDDGYKVQLAQVQLR